jgi:hypothetical protein
MAKYLQCSECGKLAFYYDDYVGTEKPFYRRFMRYPEGETKYEPPRCFTCGGVPRLIHENIKEEKAACQTLRSRPATQSPSAQITSAFVDGV